MQEVGHDKNGERYPCPMPQATRRIRRWVIDMDMLVVFLRNNDLTKLGFTTNLPPDAKVVGIGIDPYQQAQVSVFVESETFRPVSDGGTPFHSVLEVFMSEKK